ncbi:MAG TPA: flagellar basal body rod C-terminal domain-containing protein, partial [Burkholderiaceae bacterium]|nr:flagellar basal body rod C-terminal domain-containing protein [Burkholderiaceae bacterium]
RSYNDFLTKQAASTRSPAAYDSQRLDLLKQLEGVFPTGEAGVGYTTTQFLNAMSDLAARPSDMPTRQVALSRAEQVATRFRQAGEQLDEIQKGVNTDLRNEVAKVNDLAKRLGEVNDQIAAAHGIGHQPNDLLDEQDRLVSQLSDYLQLNTVPAADGSISVFIAGGQQLVLGKQALQLQVKPDAYDPAQSAVGVAVSGQVLDLPPALLGTGSIAGLLLFQNNDLDDAANMLGQLAVSISGTVNAQQAMGLDLGVPASPGAPIFAVGAPRALPAASNGKDAQGNFLTSVSITVADPTQLLASDYTLDPDPNTADTYTLTRRSDGLARTLTVDPTTGAVTAPSGAIDGMTITIGPPTPATTDSFLLQAVGRATQSMRRVLDDPKGIAAASPVTAASASTNTGTASVASLTVVSPTVNPQNTATISFTSSTGDYNWQLVDSTTNAVVANGTGTWTPGTPIALNGFELQLNGVPANGDSFTVSKTQYPAVNNGNALAMAAFRDKPLVGRTQSGGVVTGGVTLSEGYATAMADIGVRVQSATTAHDTSSHVAAAAEQQHAQLAGVNLDEEAAKLIQFQQSYQAAAKVLQVAQTLFDTLLDAAKR